MFINTELIHNIVINTFDGTIDFDEFVMFLEKSPFVRRIVFIGQHIFDSPRFLEILSLCRSHNIALIFGDVPETTLENISGLVQCGNVYAINILETNKNIKTINELKEKLNTDYPVVHIIPESTNTRDAQFGMTRESYAFYNLADDMRKIPCLKLLQEPMINHDGQLLGCWENPPRKYKINAFHLGLERAMNNRYYLNIFKMLRTQKLDFNCPCARCPVFASMLWTNKKIDIKQ